MILSFLIVFQDFIRKIKSKKSRNENKLYFFHSVVDVKHLKVIVTPEKSSEKTFNAVLKSTNQHLSFVIYSNSMHTHILTTQRTANCIGLPQRR